jgi:hypothetical protein
MFPNRLPTYLEPSKSGTVIDLILRSKAIIEGTDMENQVMQLSAGIEQLLPLAPEIILAETLETIVANAETTLGGRACWALHQGPVVEVELMGSSGTVEAVFEAETGELVDTVSVGPSRRGKRMARALDRTVLSLIDAMDVAKGAIGPGETLEATLLSAGRSGGRRFEIAVRTSDGTFSALVDAATGRLLQVLPYG